MYNKYKQEIYYSEQTKVRYKLKIINEISKYYKSYKDWMITTNTELHMFELEDQGYQYF